MLYKINRTRAADTRTQSIMNREKRPKETKALEGVQYSACSRQLICRLIVGWLVGQCNFKSLGVSAVEFGAPAELPTNVEVLP